MRIISEKLLREDILKNNIPIWSIWQNRKISGSKRASFIKYFDIYLEFWWDEEPKSKHLDLLAKIVSDHLNEEIKTDDIIHHGHYLQPTSALKQVEEVSGIYFVKSELSDTVLPPLEAYIATGATIERVRYNDGPIEERVRKGNEIERKALLEAIHKESTISSLPTERIIHWRGSSGTTLSAHTILELLEIAAIRTNANTALRLVNAYLLDPYRVTDHYLALEGFRLEQELVVSPGQLKIIPKANFQEMPAFQSWESSNLNRRGIKELVAIVQTVKSPKFEYTGTKYQNRTRETNHCFNILSLFGPSSPTRAASFRDHPIDIFSLIGRRGSFGTPNSDGAISHHTPFFPNIENLPSIYESYTKLPSKVQSRMAVATERLRRSVGLRTLADKAIELGIALEASLLSGNDQDGTSGEITYRLASRGAWLLGDTMEDRKKIFMVLKAAYKLRSKAAHEGNVNSTTKGVYKGQPPMHTLYLLQDASDICARAIIKIIDLGEFPDWTEVILGESRPSPSSQI